MARALREVETGVCFHVINRGNNRQEIFKKPGHYAAFLTVLTIALGRFDIELLGYCLMPNHWHLIIRARPSGSIPNFMRWLTLTYVRRHHAHCEGETEHLYQGRYKSFPVEEDDHFLVLCRYVESNPLRAKMVHSYVDQDLGAGNITYAGFMTSDLTPANLLNFGTSDSGISFEGLINNADTLAYLYTEIGK